jgi:hypothetical protein
MLARRGCNDDASSASAGNQTRALGLLAFGRCLTRIRSKAVSTNHLRTFFRRLKLLLLYAGGSRGPALAHDAREGDAEPDRMTRRRQFLRISTQELRICA